jgi:hypothetical protein
VLAIFSASMQFVPRFKWDGKKTRWVDKVLIVADDSSLRQAIDVETKRNAGLSRSVTKPDAETSHAPTLQDNSGVPQAVIPLFKVRERSVTLGKCG